MEQSVNALQELIEVDEDLAKKETLFHSSKIRARQAAQEEAASPMAPAPGGAEAPAFLRRKAQSGKKE